MAEKSLVKEHFIEYVDHLILKHRVSHAYLIEIDDYDKDMFYVYNFIKMILCDCTYHDLKTSNNPIIKQIDHNNYPDLRIVSSDTNVINKSMIIDLQKEFSNKSLLNGKRIYVILEAEKLNGYSANTILKFLEEPEDDIIAFLITKNRYRVIDTILSRCQKLSLKENTSVLKYDDNTLDFLKCVLNPNNFFIKYNYYIKSVFVDKNVMKEHLNLIENVIITYLENKDNLQKEYQLLLSKKDLNELIRIISVIEDELPKLDFNVNFKLWIDSLFSRLIGG